MSHNIKTASTEAERGARPIPKTIRIVGRRWFDSRWGNTYFTAEIIVDGELVHNMEMEYGYGDHYCDRAFEWLSASEYIDRPKHENGGSEPPRLFCERVGIGLERSVCDVKRRKDL